MVIMMKTLSSHCYKLKLLMFVKIDTRQDFKILRPVIPKLHAIMADELGKEIIDNMSTPPHHLILEMDEVVFRIPELAERLGEIQSLAAAEGYSFIICGMKGSLDTELNKIPAFKNLNKVPTLAEAIDLVMMEKLERDLLGGE